MKNKICVYAICKNESKFIDKWLDSMQEADYIVVLDTGSTDDTVEKLKADKRVTRVEQKIISPWRFDVARNESMKLVPDDANILVCTDFDEVLNPGWAKVLKSVWKEGKVNRVFYQYAWSHNSIGEPTDVFKYDKIHTRDFYWKYPVHEVLYPKEGVEAKFVDVEEKIYLHHYPDPEKSRSSYFDLLLLSAKENPNDPHVQMLLAREYYVREEYNQSLEKYLSVLHMPEIDYPNNRMILLESLGRCASLYVILKNYDEALWYCQEFIKEDYTYREPYLIMAEVYNDMGMYTLAEACVRAALEYGIRKYDWIERAGTWISLPNDILGISQFNLGKIDEAIENTQICLNHDPDNVRILKNYNLFLLNKIQKLQKE